jgi:peptide/nickel transport system substrate-binding protein
MRHPRYRVGVSIVLVLSFALTACGSVAKSNVLKIGWTGNPDSLNPGVGLSSDAYDIYNLVYDALYQLQPDGTFTLELAESVDVSEDGKTWTFKIRDGVLFHDGKPLTAEDVAFTFNLYMQHMDDFPYMSGYVIYFESVEAVDDNTVVIKLTEAIPNMKAQLYYMYILPKHIWGSLEGTQATEFANEEMIGSGPFKLVEFKDNEFVHLATNKQHFLYHPKMDEVIFQRYESPESLVDAITQGQVDMITRLPLDKAAGVGQVPDVQMVAGRPYAPIVSDILINHIDPEDCPKDDELVKSREDAGGSLCTGHPALRDLTVRRALAYATDKARIISDVTYGLAEPGLTLIPTGLGQFYNIELEDYPYDIEEANRILDKAGYADTDGDGIREMPDGTNPLSFRLDWDEAEAANAKEANLLKESWSKIGIAVELRPVAQEVLYGNCCPSYDYDIQIGQWGSDPDPNFLLSVPMTDGIPSGLNETGYANSAYDSMYLDQATTLNESARRNIIWDMQKLMLDDIVYIIPYYPKSVQAYREDNYRGWLVDEPTLALQDLTNLTKLVPLEK